MHFRKYFRTYLRIYVHMYEGNSCTCNNMQQCTTCTSYLHNMYFRTMQYEYNVTHAPFYARSPTYVVKVCIIDYAMQIYVVCTQSLCTPPICSMQLHVHCSIVLSKIQNTFEGRQLQTVCTYSILHVTYIFMLKYLRMYFRTFESTFESTKVRRYHAQYGAEVCRYSISCLQQQ